MPYFCCNLFVSAARVARLTPLALGFLLFCSHLQADTGITPGDAIAVPDTSVLDPAVIVESQPVIHYTSLLDTIGAEFTLPSDLNRRTEQQLNWYVRHPDYVQRVFERARPYLPYIVQQIRERGMPLELALLPVVESAFDPFAYSHGRAAGLWQFIPGTGRVYGLEQNWWYDGRRDPIASTDAALNYLQHLHRRLDGDWLLAVAAYNSGEGRVRGAVRKNRRKGKATDFWNLSLPKETRAYVPKLLAISHLVKNPWQYNIQLPLITDQQFFAEVNTGGQIDLALVADLAGIEVQDLYRLNAGLNRWATPPDGPHRLAVPVDVSWQLQEKLDQLPANQRVKWKRHKIRDGEVLGTIARKYGTTVSVIKAANSLRGTAIRAGQHLVIPVATKNLSSYGLSADMRQASVLSRADRGHGIRYTVKTGDSFWKIAQRHGVGTRQLARWNNMAPGDTLSVGKELLIKGGRQSTSTSAPTITPDGKRRKIRYTVRRGDSLSRISSRFKVSVTDLRRWNKLNGKYLQPGQKLNLYIDVTRQSGS